MAYWSQQQTGFRLELKAPNSGPNRPTTSGQKSLKLGQLVSNCWGNLGQLWVLPGAGNFRDARRSNAPATFGSRTSRCHSRRLQSRRHHDAGRPSGPRRVRGPRSVGGGALGRIQRPLPRDDGARWVCTAGCQRCMGSPLDLQSDRSERTGRRTHVDGRASEFIPLSKSRMVCHFRV